MYTMAKIANLAEKKRQMAGENLNEVTKSASYKVEKLTKFAMGLENNQIGWQKWPLGERRLWRKWRIWRKKWKQPAMAKNRRRAGKNFNKITRGAPCKEEKLTEWRIWQKWWIWPKFTMGLTNIQVGCHKWPLGKWRIWWNGEQGEAKAKMTNLAIIRPRCNKLLKEAPSLVTNLVNNLP